MDALGWAYAVEYAKKQQGRRPARRRASKKLKLGVFLWFLGIGF